MSVLGKLAWLRSRAEMAYCGRVLTDVESVQRRTLRRLLRTNAASEYGRRFGFASIRSPREYAARVPRVTYSDLAADLQEARTRSGVLCAAPVVQWVYSSGTSGTPKLVPHTAASIGQWCRGYARTVYAYATSLPAADRLFAGEAIYDVAPARVREIDGVPAGYISGVAAQRNARLRRLENIPAWITALPCHGEKLAALLRWSIGRDITAASGITSFVYLLLRYVRDNAASLADEPSFPRDACDGAGAVSLHRLWPHFDLVVSTGVAVDLYRPLLAELVPRAAVRDAYTASEGAFAFSDDAQSGLLLNTDLYYFELTDPDGGGPCQALHEGVPGVPYQLVVSATNGLWRYCTGDVVRLLGVDPARIQVLGRSGHSVNLTGEKLLEGQITEAVVTATRRAGLSCSDYFFFGWVAPAGFMYCVALEPDRPLEPEREFLERFATLIERENHLFHLLRQRARTELHLIRLRPGTFHRLTESAETARGAVGHAKLSRVTTLERFVSLVRPEDIAHQTLVPGVHETSSLAAGALSHAHA